MRKRFLAVMTLSAMMATFVVPFSMGQSRDLTTTDSTTAQETTTTMVSESETIASFESVENIVTQKETPIINETMETRDIVEEAIGNMTAEMESISHIRDKEEWFTSYKKIINKYSDILDPPETIYDVFSPEELDLLFRVVHAEIGDEWSFEQKVNVANVIYNRLESDEFGESLITVLIPGQFSSISNGAYKNTPSEKTIAACEYAFMIENTVGDALFFDSNGAHMKSSKLELILNDGAHRFYRIKEKKK